MSKRSAQVVRAAIGAVVVLVSMLAPGAASARPLAPPQPVLWQDEIVLAQAVQRGPVTLQEAISMAMRRFGGRVIRAETKVQGGVRVHEIRLLDESTSRVRTVRIDAETGQFR